MRLRNFGSWTNRLLRRHRLVRPGGPARRAAGPPLRAVRARRDHRPAARAGGHAAGGGGIWWRRGDDFKNAPANGPAAILAARTGDLDFAATITDWIAATLVDPHTGLVRDGVRLNPDGTIRTVEATTYTYCQGVYLGACVELAERDGHPRWADRAATVLNAVTTMAGPDGVIPGFDDGGDGGLFNGILARYLADTAVRRPELTALAAPLVLASADAAWQGRTDLDDADDPPRRPGVRPRLAPPGPHPAPGCPRGRPLGTALRLDGPRSGRPAAALLGGVGALVAAAGPHQLDDDRDDRQEHHQDEDHLDVAPHERELAEPRTEQRDARAHSTPPMSEYVK